MQVQVQTQRLRNQEADGPQPESEDEALSAPMAKKEKVHVPDQQRAPHTFLFCSDPQQVGEAHRGEGDPPHLSVDSRNTTDTPRNDAHQPRGPSHGDTKLPITPLTLPFFQLPVRQTLGDFLASPGRRVGTWIRSHAELCPQRAPGW